jgi:predicted nucleic acid-binding protein
MHLLDTNILTALHADHPKIIAALSQLNDPQVAITIVTADLLIASIALANHATLVTRNLKDFQRIPNLKLFKVRLKSTQSVNNLKK